MDKYIKKTNTLLNKNSIPFMEILENASEENGITIKVYYPKILLSICKILDDNFIIQNKKNIFLKKDLEGYSFIELELDIDEKIIKIRLEAMLKETWGIADFS